MDKSHIGNRRKGRLFEMINQYSFWEKIQTACYLVITKLFYKNARLIRFPFYCRGVQKLSFKSGFTTGRNCRFDLYRLDRNHGAVKTLFFGENCKIGDNVHIVAIDKIVFGDDCLLASNIFITDTSHGIYNGENQTSPYIIPDDRELVTKPIVIGDRVWIGENVVILPGVKIGSGVIIGANSVVNCSVEDNTIIAGVPSKVIKKYNENNSRWERVSN